MIHTSLSVYWQGAAVGLWSPMRLAMPEKRVAYCTQQDGSQAASADGFSQLGLAQQGETGGCRPSRKTECINLCSVHGHLRETWERAAEDHGDSCATDVWIHLLCQCVLCQFLINTQDINIMFKEIIIINQCHVQTFALFHNTDQWSVRISHHVSW